MLLNITPPPQRLPIHNNPLPTSRLVHSLGVGIQVGGFRSGSVGSGRRSWRGWVQVGGEGGGGRSCSGGGGGGWGVVVFRWEREDVQGRCSGW